MQQPATFEVNGDAIREDRMQKGFETSQLADLAGISRRYLCHLENGTRRHMRPSRYFSLRTALDITDDRLLATPRTARKE